MAEKKPSRYLSLIKDTGIFAIGTLGSKLVLFFLVPLYTNILNEEQYGTAELVITIGQLVMPFISICIYEGMFRFGLSGEEKRERAFLNASIIFVIGSVAMVAITPLFSFYHSVSVWKWYLCGYVVASFASSNTLNYLKVKDRNKLYSILNILHALLLVACNVIFLIVIKTGIEGYLLSTIISTVITVVLAFLFGGMISDLHNATYDSELMKEMILYSIPLILNSVSWWVIHSSDKIMVEWILDASLLGLYTAASKIPSLMNVAITIFSQAWRLSSIKEYDSSNDTQFYSNVFKYYYEMIFGVCILITAITKIFMKFYVGNSFFEAWRFVPLLLLSAAFNAFSSFSGSMFEALKKSKTVMSTTLIAGIINIILNFILIPLIGIYGAVLGTLGAYIVIAILRMRGVYKHIKIDYSLKKFIPLVLITVIQTVLVTMDFQIYIVSGVVMIVYLIICFRDFSEMTKMIKKIIRR